MERRRRKQAVLTHTALLCPLMAIEEKARQSGGGAHRKACMMLAKANMPRRLTGDGDSRFRVSRPNRTGKRGRCQHEPQA
jgi:hypothetical protein